MRCPRCGREGKPAVKKVRSKGREYWYRVVRHPDGSVCIVERLSERGEGVAAGERGYELIAAAHLIDSLAEELAECRRALRAAVEALAAATRIIELYSSGFAELTAKIASRREPPERA